MSTGSARPVDRLVLIVEDEPLIADVLDRYLRREGFRTRIVGDGPAAVDAARAQQPDLVLLDIGLPGIDGFDVLGRLRAVGDVPVILVTARVDDVDRLVGFRLGADDYVTKPFNPAEVVARVHAVLRRAEGPPAEGQVLRIGELEVRTDARTVAVGAQRIALTPSEYQVLEHLALHPRRAFGRGELLDQLDDSIGGDRVVDAHIASIRRRLRTAAAGSETIVETVRGVGYRLLPTE